ncbi:M48 family metallopeptidase [Nereida sp. MMG025]|uniref:M48 family metallopeptidase n=1 Tax=Nereida sp. MMG025 TaxID=2909981 RepID=UPI001F247525|nr:M48 family metallopeptidase [Nereida sp. MMG025]MCF6445934.1 M48 family metallopeptidase [Nereida sp. MMG025]
MMAEVTQARASFFDGKTAGKQAVLITSSRALGALRIETVEGHLIAEWPLSDLRQHQDGAHMVLFMQGDPDEARLTPDRLDDAKTIALIAQDLHQRAPLGPAVKKMAVWGAGAVAALVLMIFVIIPSLANQLAVLIPPEREQRIGQTVLAQIEGALTFGQDGEEDTSWVCENPQGTAALDVMAQTLIRDMEFPYDLSINVVDHEMINAFAVPGGQVILMRGLLEEAETPEEVAGVLAHELGHVANRDPMRLALRAAGSAGILSLVLGDATGGLVIAGAAEQVLNASHTRAAEADADVFALDMMESANLPPEAFATFFDRLIEEHGDVHGALELVSSHPASARRAERARDRVDQDATYARVLTDDQWQDLRAICAD